MGLWIFFSVDFMVYCVVSSAVCLCGRCRSLLLLAALRNGWCSQLTADHTAAAVFRRKEYGT